MDEAKIRQIFQEEIANYMQDNMFSGSNIPNHSHNGTDSIPLPLSSIIEAIPVDATDGGVFNPKVLDTQTVNNEYTSGKLNPQTVYTLPVNIIYGFGVGVHSQFNGGNAIPGTMVLFENGSILSSLNIYTANGWRSFSTQGTPGPTGSIGPTGPTGPRGPTGPTGP